MKNVLGDIFLKKQKICGLKPDTTLKKLPRSFLSMDEKCPWGHFSKKTKNMWTKT